MRCKFSTSIPRLLDGKLAFDIPRVVHTLADAFVGLIFQVESIIPYNDKAWARNHINGGPHSFPRAISTPDIDMMLIVLQVMFSVSESMNTPSHYENYDPMLLNKIHVQAKQSLRDLNIITVNPQEAKRFFSHEYPFNEDSQDTMSKIASSLLVRVVDENVTLYQDAINDDETLNVIFAFELKSVLMHLAH